MTAAFDLERLTKIEKLQLFEQLWSDLSNHTDFVSPQWHADILEHTEKLVTTGQSQFMDWQDAKKHLLNKK